MKVEEAIAFNDGNDNNDRGVVDDSSNMKN